LETVTGAGAARAGASSSDRDLPRFRQRSSVAGAGPKTSCAASTKIRIHMVVKTVRGRRSLACVLERRLRPRKNTLGELSCIRQAQHPHCARSTTVDIHLIH
jgi:hypothetical protein